MPTMHRALAVVCLTAIPVCLASEPASPEPAQPAAGEAQAQGHTITWSWPADEPVVYTLSRVTEDVVPVPGKDPVHTRTITRRVRHEVVEPSGEAPTNATAVRLTWDGIHFINNDEVGEHLEYNSDLEHHRLRVGHPGIAMIAASLGQSITYLMRPDGDLVGIEGHDEFLRGMERNLDRWGLADERTYENLQRMFTPVVLADTTEPTYRFMPTGRVAEGESYTVTRILIQPKVGIVRTHETHTLDRVEVDDRGREIAVFSVTGDVRWPEPAPEILERFAVSVDRSEIAGEWTYDLGMGLPLSYEVRTSFLADVVQYDPATNFSTEITTKQTVTDTLELVPQQPGLDSEASGTPFDADKHE